ncbi:hypothetical protein B0H11DRAFT_1907123 [Mycena galericulata]|nr:hypothetical protein B0H11DRAFT_1907123 [Mycena galericulata]
MDQSTSAMDLDFPYFSVSFDSLDDFRFTKSNGDDLVPIWSVLNGQKWCSLLGAPSNIAPDANLFIHKGISYPKVTDKFGGLEVLDWENYAVFYDPAHHWFGFNPADTLRPIVGTIIDPVEFAFDQTPVRVTELYNDVQRAGGSDDGDSPDLIGYTLDAMWVSNTIYISQRLKDIAMAFVMKSSFYGPNSWTTRLGDLPDQVSVDELQDWFYLKKDAQAAAGNARRNILSQMGFVSWFMSLTPNWTSELESEDADFLPKRGVIFDLSRDYHEANFYHFARYDVPIHYAWTNKEEGKGRFVRYSQRFLDECVALRTGKGPGPIDLHLLPCFEALKDDLARYDVFFQDRYLGRVGEVLTSFRPSDSYYAVDFQYYGARPLDNAYERRAYATRFKGLLKLSITGRTCTLFRQNPIRKDEPAFSRDHASEENFPLTDFASASAIAASSDDGYFFDSTFLLREKVKNRCAPRPGRLFNNYNGMRETPGHGSELAGPSQRSGSLSSLHSGSGRSQSPGEVLGPAVVPEGRPMSLKERLEFGDLRRARSPMSPTHYSGENEPALTGWALSLASSSTRRRSSRSLSPRRGSSTHLEVRGRSISSERSGAYHSATDDRINQPSLEEGEIDPRDEERTAGDDIMETPFNDNPRPMFRYQTRQDAVEAIEQWAPFVTPLEPPPSPNQYTDEDWFWVMEWAN